MSSNCLTRYLNDNLLSLIDSYRQDPITLDFEVAGMFNDVSMCLVATSDGRIIIASPNVAPKFTPVKCEYGGIIQMINTEDNRPYALTNEGFICQLASDESKVIYKSSSFEAIYHHPNILKIEEDILTGNIGAIAENKLLIINNNGKLRFSHEFDQTIGDIGHMSGKLCISLVDGTTYIINNESKKRYRVSQSLIKVRQFMPMCRIDTDWNIIRVSGNQVIDRIPAGYISNIMSITCGYVDGKDNVAIVDIIGITSCGSIIAANHKPIIDSVTGGITYEPDISNIIPIHSTRKFIMAGDEIIVKRADGKIDVGSISIIFDDVPEVKFRRLFTI